MNYADELKLCIYALVCWQRNSSFADFGLRVSLCGWVYSVFARGEKEQNKFPSNCTALSTEFQSNQSVFCNCFNFLKSYQFVSVWLCTLAYNGWQYAEAGICKDSFSPCPAPDETCSAPDETCPAPDESPVTNFAKANNQKTASPPEWCMTECWKQGDFFYLNNRR